MTSQRWQKIDAILDAVLEAPATERHTILHQLCDGHASLEREILSLLAASETDSRFIEQPVAEIMRAHSNAQPTLEKTIGAYRIVREIGRGGMGIVYLAERNDGAYQQQVAIKLIWSQMQTPLRQELIQRFWLERQILATLNHPNIARLLDAGTMATGLPYVVIEYVTGVSLLEYCAQKQLSVRARLQLFLQVCEAVQFAHQKLIIHRDLKPGNILVTEDGTVKLLDFGIAKLLQPEPELTPSNTQTLQILTPEYASPEQIRGEPSTTSSDVYSLGLILYELLTHQRPYHTKNLSLPTLLRVVCEQTPPKPSTIAKALTATDELLTGLPAPKLSAHLKGDLDTIIMTALEKAPERRYTSVWQFSEDIRRYLNGHPIQAQTANVGYRVNKFLRRNKKYVFATALLLITLLGGIVATLRQARIANELAQSRRRVLYAAQMNLAAQAWNSNNLARVRELLIGHLPAPGEEDLRGFEWYYFWRLLHSNGQLFSLSHSKGLWRATYSPNGEQIASVGEDNAIHLWDAATGQHSKALTGHTDLIKNIAYTPDGSRIVSSSADATARLWSIDGQPLHVLKGHQAKVNQAAFAPDGKTVATAADDGNWKLWDVATGQQLLSVKAHANLTRAIAFSPNGQIIATAGNQNTVRLWQARTGQEIPFAGNQDKWQGWTLAFSPDGTRLAVGGYGSSVKIWDVRTGQVLSTLAIDANWIEGVAISPDGQQIAATSDKRTVTVWDFATGRRIAILKGHTNSVNSVAFAPDGKRLLTSSLDNTVRVWDLPQLIREFDQEPVRKDNGVIDYALDFRRFAQAIENTVLIGAVATQTIERRMHGHQNFVSKIAFAPNGRQIASGGLDQTIKLWSLTADAAPLTLTGHTGEISALCYSLDGQYVAAGSSDNRLSLWRAVDGQLVWMSQPLPSFINKIAFSADNQWLATGSFDNVVRLWQIRTGEIRKTLEGHQKLISALAFSPNAQLLATGSEDDTVQIWDVRRGALQFTIKELLGHITALTFAPDGRRLVIGSHDGFVSLWDPQTQQEMLTSKAHQNSLLRLAFTPDGQTLITADRIGLVRYWRAASPLEQFSNEVK
jgi:eukaryotic-like serine/threonine-protein kinase